MFINKLLFEKFFLVFLLFSFISSFSQENKQIDSLKKSITINNQKNWSIYNEISKKYYSINRESCLKYFNLAINLNKKNDYNKGSLATIKISL